MQKYSFVRERCGGAAAYIDFAYKVTNKYLLALWEAEVSTREKNLRFSGALSNTDVVGIV